MRFFLVIFYTSLFSCAAATEIDLQLYESSFYSPNGEDGIFARLFSTIKPSAPFCVECGASDGVTNSLTYLLRNQGWKALLLDRSYDISAMNLHREFLTAENVNQLFQKYQVPYTFDLLTIDVDYNDFYIWQAIDERYRPTVVCIAYNAQLGATEDKVVLYHPYFCGDGTNHFGASILALFQLGLSKGYSLIYAETAGRHLFFMRNDVLSAKQLSFKNVNEVAKLYHSPDFENGKATFRPDPKNRKYISYAEASKK